MKYFNPSLQFQSTINLNLNEITIKFDVGTTTNDYWQLTIDTTDRLNRQFCLLIESVAD